MRSDEVVSTTASMLWHITLLFTYLIYIADLRDPVELQTKMNRWAILTIPRCIAMPKVVQILVSCMRQYF